jgi:hypothetical protein
LSGLFRSEGRWSFNILFPGVAWKRPATFSGLQRYCLQVSHRQMLNSGGYSPCRVQTLGALGPNIAAPKSGYDRFRRYGGDALFKNFLSGWVCACDLSARPIRLGHWQVSRDNRPAPSAAECSSQFRRADRGVVPQSLIALAECGCGRMGGFSGP